MIGGLRGEIATLREQAAKKPVEQSPPEKVFSRAELRGLVDEGKITQEAADAYLDKQAEERITQKVTATVTAKLTDGQRAATVEQVLGEYRALVPAAWEEGSKERAKVAKEFKALVALGAPDNKVTEAAALRAAFGDPEVIRESRATGRRGPGETHVETGGGDKPGAGDGKDDGPPKGLDVTKAAYYQKQIDKGIYPDWKAVRTELAYKPPKRA